MTRFAAPVLRRPSNIVLKNHVGSDEERPVRHSRLSVHPKVERVFGHTEALAKRPRPTRYLHRSFEQPPLERKHGARSHCNDHTRHDACCASRAMDRPHRYAWMLREAADTVGGKARLAAQLGVKPDLLDRWLSGEQEAPLEVFMDALDVIADGAVLHTRPIRVAAIKNY